MLPLEDLGIPESSEPGGGSAKKARGWAPGGPGSDVDSPFQESTIYVGVYTHMYVCMYACIVCMYVCMCVCIYVYIYAYAGIGGMCLAQ